MTNILYIGATSACFEIKGKSPYYAPAPYKVLVDGEERFESDTNVFSLFDLRPNTLYTVAVVQPNDRSELEFRTKRELCCLNVRDFGAVGDGVAEDTSAIQAAINCLPSGGRLFFPAGDYRTLPLSLRSHITLELSQGAVLRAIPQRERYPVIPGACADPVTGGEIPLTAFEGAEKPSYQSIIHASYAVDIQLIGKGVIDGGGQEGGWWDGFENFPAARPRTLFFNRCQGITLHGITVRNSPAWNIHPYFCRKVQILNISVQAPEVSPNTDALDPESCENVRIIGCRFSVGDDCVAIKAGKLEQARKYRQSAVNHVIRNCLMEHGHGGVTMGSELAAGIRDTSVTRCLFRGTERGLRIKSRRGRGKDSVITNVEFDNIRMENVLTPIVINMWYNCCDEDRHSEYVWSREKLPVDDRTPHLGSFCFRNIECTGAEIAACYIDGLPESPIDQVTLENVRVSFAKDARPGIPALEEHMREHCRLGFYLENVRRVELDHVKISGAEGPALLTPNCGEVEEERFEAD